MESPFQLGRLPLTHRWPISLRAWCFRILYKKGVGDPLNDFNNSLSIMLFGFYVSYAWWHYD